jgi:hypothetical protein
MSHPIFRVGRYLFWRASSLRSDSVVEKPGSLINRHLSLRRGHADRPMKTQGQGVRTRSTRSRPGSWPRRDLVAPSLARVVSLG